MIRHILSTFVARFFIAVSNLAIAILLSNFTGAAGRGEQSLIITLITFIIIITGIIGSSSIAYLLPRHSIIALILPSYLWVIAVAGLCYILLPLLNLISPGFTTDICLLSLLLSFVNINSGILISKQRIVAANIIGLFQAFIIVAWLLFSFLVLNNKSVFAYIHSLYFGYGLSFLLSLFYIRTYLVSAKKESVKSIFNAAKQLSILGFFNQVAVFTQMLSFRLSYYLLNAWFGTGEVGIYSNAVSIAESVWLIGRSMATVQHSRIVNSNDARFSLKLTSRINTINFLITVTIVLIMAFIPDSFYQWVFGNEFIGINRIIRFIGPGIIFFGIALIQGYYFSSTGKHYVNAISSSAGLIVTIVLGFILIPEYSSAGAGITASVSYAITALVVLFFYNRELKKHSLKK